LDNRIFQEAPSFLEDRPTPNWFLYKEWNIMTEEQKDPREQEEAVKQAAPRSEAGQRRTWPIVVIVIAVILVLCSVVVCIAAAIALFVRTRPVTFVPTPPPAVEVAPVQPAITIIEPAQGDIVDIAGTVQAHGTGRGLPEGNLVVEVSDGQGNLLDRRPVTLQGRDVGTGAEGTWSVELNVDVEPGTAGVIRAYAESPANGSVIAEASVKVSLGIAQAVPSYIKIEEPTPGEALEIAQPVLVRGTGAGLPGGNVVVQALDAEGNVLDQEPATLQGPDVATGGEGSWSVELEVPVSGQVPGFIAAFWASPEQRALVASDHVEVTFYGAYTLEGITWVLDKTIAGSEITAEFTAATGSEGAMVNGSAGCNSYRGPYTATSQDGEQGQIEIGPLATTKMRCELPLMDQEALFLAALEAATSYEIQGFALTIAYPGGELLFYDKDGPRPRR
jgi:heat shock protein HslJ